MVHFPSSSTLPTAGGEDLGPDRMAWWWSNCYHLPQHSMPLLAVPRLLESLWGYTTTSSTARTANHQSMAFLFLLILLPMALCAALCTCCVLRFGCYYFTGQTNSETAIAILSRLQLVSKSPSSSANTSIPGAMAVACPIETPADLPAYTMVANIVPLCSSVLHVPLEFSPYLSFYFLFFDWKKRCQTEPRQLALTCPAIRLINCPVGSHVSQG